MLSHCLQEIPSELEEEFEDVNKLYPNHIPTTWFQKGLLAVGSGLAAFFDPKRDGMFRISGSSCTKLCT